MSLCAVRAYEKRMSLCKVISVNCCGFVNKRRYAKVNALRLYVAQKRVTLRIRTQEGKKK